MSILKCRLSTGYPPHRLAFPGRFKLLGKVFPEQGERVDSAVLIHTSHGMVIQRD